jgi:hypothetical protein
VVSAERGREGQCPRLRERTVVAPAVWTFGIAKHTSISVSHAMPLVRDLITAIPSVQGSPWPHHARTLLWTRDDSVRSEAFIEESVDRAGRFIGVEEVERFVQPFSRSTRKSRSSRRRADQ